MSCQETPVLFVCELNCQLSKKLYKEGNHLSFSVIFTLFSKDSLVVSHQAHRGLSKISWKNPSASESCRSIVCHQVRWELSSSNLVLSGSSATSNSIMIPHLYANRIKCSLLQIFIKTILFFFSNWDSLYNIH